MNILTFALLSLLISTTIPVPPESVTLVMTGNGVGGVSAETPFDPEVIEAALPGFLATLETTSVEGAPQTVIRVRKGEEVVLEIYADRKGKKVGTILSVGGFVKGPSGEVVGMIYGDMAEPQTLRCAAAGESYSGYALCHREGEPSLLFLFGPHNWGGPDNLLPPDEALEKAPLARIVWRAMQSVKE